jgi:hypothetical protein
MHADDALVFIDTYKNGQSPSRPTTNKYGGKLSDPRSSLPSKVSCAAITVEKQACHVRGSVELGAVVSLLTSILTLL